MGRRNKGLMPTVSEALLTIIIVSIGVFIWAVALSNTQINRIIAQKELNEELSVLNSPIELEYAYYPMNTAAIRNIGEKTISVIQLVVYENGKLVWSSGVGNITVIKPGESSLVSFECPNCMFNSSKILVIHYIPLELLRTIEEDGELIVAPVSDVIHYKVESGRIENQWFGREAIACPLPEDTKWAVIDFVEPLVRGANDRLAGPVKVRVPLASEDGNVETMVRVVGGGGDGDGSKVLAIPSVVEDTIPTSSYGLRFPITVSIDMDGWKVIQGEWLLGAYRINRWRYAYVDSVKLIWNSDNQMLTGGFVKVFIRYWGPARLNYTISIDFYNCKGERIAGGELNTTTKIGFGDYGLWEERYITLNNQVSLLDVYRIEARVRLNP